MLKKLLTKMLKCSAILVVFLLWATLGLLLAQDKLSQGIEAYKAGKFDQAIQLLSEFISSNPNEPDAYFYLGNAYFQKGDFKQAISSYLKALENNPKDPDLLFQLGLAYYNNKEHKSVPHMISGKGIILLDKRQRHNEKNAQIADCRQ